MFRLKESTKVLLAAFLAINLAIMATMVACLTFPELEDWFFWMLGVSVSGLSLSTYAQLKKKKQHDSQSS